MSKAPQKNTQRPEVETTGHEWDGIEELNNPLPRWWLWIFYATIVWGLWYTIAYPAWPLVERATAGYLGYSTRANVAAEIDAVNERNAGLVSQLSEVDLLTIAENEELHGFAINMGSAVFRAHCSQCHGSGAGGVEGQGFPSLVDNDWIWPGTIDEIAWTVAHGIRNEQSPMSRLMDMPAFGESLADDEIDQVVQHVLALSGQDHDATLAEAGATIFYDNCASCHGDNGEGNRDMGAPTLNDRIWLYGGDVDSITQSVRYSRGGVMPAWSDEFRPAGGLTQAEVNAVAAYVHQLGGGY